MLRSMVGITALLIATACGELPLEPVRPAMLQTSSSPLVIVDGAVLETGVGISAYDIESIEIIRGASSMYSSRTICPPIRIVTNRAPRPDTLSREADSAGRR